MKKTIKVDDLKKEIEKMVNYAMEYLKDGNKELYEYVYNKAIFYTELIQKMCIDYSKPSYEKEYSELDNWFTEITNKAIDK